MSPEVEAKCKADMQANRERMMSSLHLVLSDDAKSQAVSRDDLKAEGKYAERIQDARIATAPNYAPAHLMLPKR